MAVYVDKPRWRFRRMVMCHMTADRLDELHEMAFRIGLKWEWFQSPVMNKLPHYDVGKKKRALAVEFGAHEVCSKTIVRVARRLEEHWWIEEGYPNGVIRHPKG